MGHSAGMSLQTVAQWQHWQSFNNINTLRPRQNGCHFAENISKCVFLNENIWISINISLKFVPKGPIKNIPALVRIMACRLASIIWTNAGIFLISLLTHSWLTRPQWVNAFRIRRYYFNLIPISNINMFKIKPRYVFPGGHCCENITNTHVFGMLLPQFGVSVDIHKHENSRVIYNW